MVALDLVVGDVPFDRDHGAAGKVPNEADRPLGVVGGDPGATGSRRRPPTSASFCAFSPMRARIAV